MHKRPLEASDIRITRKHQLQGRPGEHQRCQAVSGQHMHAGALKGTYLAALRRKEAPGIAMKPEINFAKRSDFQKQCHLTNVSKKHGQLSRFSRLLHK